MANEPELRDIYLFPLKNHLVFPHSIVPLVFHNPDWIEAVNEAMIHNEPVGLIPDLGDGASRREARHGTAATVLKMLYAPDGSVRLLLQGRRRFRIRRSLKRKPVRRARVEFLETRMEDLIRVEALERTVRELALKLASQSPFLPEELGQIIASTESPEKLVDVLAANLKLQTEEQLRLLAETVLDRRLEMVLDFLNRELKVLEVTGEIQNKVTEKIDRSQKEYLLREHLKAIKQELGEEDEEEDEWEREISALSRQIKKAGMPAEVEEVALKELDRLAEMSPMAAEYTLSRTYIDWLISLPWKKETRDTIDLTQARKILDQDHYDLNDVKDRILEFLAVRKLNKRIKGPILCFVGPPGVGKTSLGRSIARAMGRQFVRFSLGGIHDEAEIRGHRRTYIGALPGRIIQMIKEAGTRNPVFMLDEIDKLGADFRGDPAAALLEVLDPEQNKDFTDHYLDVKFDLSKVMFICTANVPHHIPPALLDRMEVIELPGYITEEKIEIARKYLIPRQIKENGLKRRHIKFTREAIEKVITDYTDEAGVRNLEREIATICRKVARRVAEGDEEPVTVTPEKVVEFLGPPRNYPEFANIKDVVGIATGLAWTPAGGEILFVESTLMPGGKTLSLTGQLGNVMQESARAALSYLRANARRYGIDPEFFRKNDIHVHVPAGAVAKDGPSAGVTIATSLCSLLTRRPVRHDVAMTGEISLRGRVLPVGGIKEKVLAARRAGIHTIILPARNEKDLREVPENIRKKMRFIFVNTLDEVFRHAIRGLQPLSLEQDEPPQPASTALPLTGAQR
ncbi:MAG: endopeptidase La [Calditrichaeota bacterium]|nr:MAG: endopeptidase La [Calditrichota bacterium]